MDIEAETRQNLSLDLKEAEHFRTLAGKWWDERGTFRGLHAFNPARIQFVVDAVQNGGPSTAPGKPLGGLSFLDVGCGGGILCEPLARLGAQMTGVDPVPDSIEAAKAHAAGQNLKINYRTATAEDLVRENAVFDAVVASEVIEHVADVPAFLTTLRALTKPGGLLIISTLNRTAKSYALAIVAAERFLGLIPRGTHDWRKFIKPDELIAAMETAGFREAGRSGIVLSPLSGGFRLSPTDFSINYIVAARAV